MRDLKDERDTKEPHKGGYIRAPLARPPREGLAPYALSDPTIAVR